MLDANELQVLTSSALEEKRRIVADQEVEKKYQQSLRRQQYADIEFKKAFPRIAQEIEAIARQGWSFCGVEISRDDLQEKEDWWNPNPQTLSGVGLLLFNEFKAKNLNPVLGWALYDQSPEYGGSLKVLFIVITWENPDSRVSERIHKNNFRSTLPLVHWINLIERGEIRVEYPDKR